LYIRRRRAKRLLAVEEQLPEALDYLSRALVAGHSLPMSLELMADEVKPPLSTELRKTVDEYNLGMAMNDALASLTRRVPSVDMQFFVSAIMTQSRTGGTLHEVLEGLAETIRERSTLKGQVRAMTANGRMTAIVLSLMPIFIALVMLYINPHYLGLLVQHPLGKTLITCAVAGQLLAYFVIRKIVDIKV
jgi:tight adherence protein B